MQKWRMKRTMASRRELVAKRKKQAKGRLDLFAQGIRLLEMSGARQLAEANIARSKLIFYP